MPDITLQELYNGAYQEAGDFQYFATPSNPTICAEAQALEAINKSIQHHVRIAERSDFAPQINSSQIDVVAEDYSVQTITVNATGGTFTVSVVIGGVTYTTSALNHNVSAADLLTALQGIFPKGPDTVTQVESPSDDFINTITWSTTPRPNIQAVTTVATALTGGTGTATVASTDSERSYQREYGIDHWLIDSSTDPDFRGDLVVWRTDVTYPAPVYWPARGDFRLKESYAAYLYNRWPSQTVFQYIGNGGSEVGQVDIGGYHYNEVMYQRGRFLGFYDTPTQAMTFEAHYLPLIPPLANDTDKIGGTLGLSYLIDHKDILDVWAAIQMRNARNLNSIQLQGRYSVLLASFMDSIEKLRPKVSMVPSRRWRA